MKIRGTLTKLYAKLDASSDVVEVITIEGKGLVEECRPFMQLPLIITLEKEQLEISNV